MNTETLYVSILVLLEVPLRLAPESSIHTPFTLFQSLFCWKFLLGTILLRFCSKFFDVSILVLLEVPLRLRRAVADVILYFVFQSLFCWKFLLGNHDGFLLGMDTRRFNPCFVGSSS